MSDPEAWRPIPSAPGYEASTLGRIRNASTGRVLRDQRNTRGYRKVHLGREQQNRLVHRLVCEAFHGPAPTGGEHADHIDFDRTNNRPDNLRWLAAAANLGRTLVRVRGGWQMDGDALEDDGARLTDEQRAQLDSELAARGW